MIHMMNLGDQLVAWGAAAAFVKTLDSMLQEGFAERVQRFGSDGEYKLRAGRPLAVVMVRSAEPMPQTRPLYQQVDHPGYGLHHFPACELVAGTPQSPKKGEGETGQLLFPEAYFAAFTPTGLTASHKIVVNDMALAKAARCLEMRAIGKAAGIPTGYGVIRQHHVLLGPDGPFVEAQKQVAVYTLSDTAFGKLKEELARVGVR